MQDTCCSGTPRDSIRVGVSWTHIHAVTVCVSTMVCLWVCDRVTECVYSVCTCAHVSMCVSLGMCVHVYKVSMMYIYNVYMCLCGYVGSYIQCVCNVCTMWLHLWLHVQCAYDVCLPCVHVLVCAYVSMGVCSYVQSVYNVTVCATWLYVYIMCDYNVCASVSVLQNMPTMCA